MDGFNVLTYDEMYCISAGGVREVVTTVVGVFGGVVGAAAGFLGGSAACAAGGFTSLVAVPVGIVTGAAGAWLGYCEAKSAAEATWDYFAELF